MVQFHQMFECITDDWHGFHVVSHLILPFYLFILVGGGWKAFWLTFSAACFFEIFEALLIEIFDSYVFFGEMANSPEYESVCNVTILDMGNAILGCALGAIVADRFTPISSHIFSKCCFTKCCANCQKERFKRFVCALTADQFTGWLEITVLLVLWSNSAGVSWYCNNWIYNCTDRNMPNYVPYGHFICAVIGITLSWIYMDKDTAVKSIVCTVTMCGLASIKVYSSAIMVYISFALLSVGFGIYRYYTRPYSRL
jgi:hypothetical protein